LVDVFGSTGTGLYGFGEDYLHTVESFLDVLERLNPHGIVSMSMYLLPPPRREIKSLATWADALRKTGINPASCIIALRSWGTLTYLIKKKSFSEGDILRLKEFARKNLFDLVYYPGIQRQEANIRNRFKEPIYFDSAQKILSLSEKQKFYGDYLFDIKPATDNKPFFFNFFKISNIQVIYKAIGKKWLPFLEGKFLVHVLFIQAILISFLFILFPLFLIRRKNKEASLSNPRYMNIFLYFFLIGMAYMFLEITFIQKFILFLGHPLYSATAVIASFLFSSGTGSYFSRKILGNKLKKNLRVCLVLLGTVILFDFWFIPVFIGKAISLPLSVRMILSFLVILPLGFLMGIPFPTGIHLLEGAEKKAIPWAWATNAFSSTISSVLVLLIAFSLGYQIIFALAAGSYLLLLPFLHFSRHRNKKHI
jgi:hypothetical protein